MPNYKESTVIGTRWTRSNSVRIFNEMNQNPQINYSEEDVVSLGNDEYLKKPVGGIGKILTPENQGTAFDIVHPLTGEVLGQSTYGFGQVWLHSFYLHIAAERDAAQVAPAPEPTPE